MKIRTLLFTTLALVALAGCTNKDVYDLVENYASFVGSIDGIQTRVNNDTIWDEGDIIGITGGCINGTVNEASNVQYKSLVTNLNGKFKPATSDYISFKDKEPVTFAAYYPYYADADIQNVSYSTLKGEYSATSTFKGPQVSVVDANGEQPTTLQKKIDFLFASATGSLANPVVKLKFEHKMSRVKIKFVSGIGAPSLDGLKYDLSNVTLTGYFNTLNGDARPNLTEKSSKTAISVTPSDPTEYSSLLLIPYSSASEALSLKVNVEGVDYNTSLPLPDATRKSLLPGYSISYIITINNNVALDVSQGDVTIENWNYQDGGNHNLDVETQPLGEASASEANLYALAFVDGTFMNIEVPDNGSLNLNLTQAQKHGCVGIVYWKGDPRADDAALKADYPDAANGLIVGLGEIANTKSDSNAPKWQKLDTKDNQKVAISLAEWQNGHLADKDYVNVGVAASGDNLSKILGYNNSKVLKVYNNSDKYTYDVDAYEYTKLYATYNQAPKATSGWFLPSPQELTSLVSGKAKLNTVLTALKSAGVTVGNINGNTFNSIVLDTLLYKSGTTSFWSSTESADDATKAYVVDSEGTVSAIAKDTNDVAVVRVVAAF